MEKQEAFVPALVVLSTAKCQVPRVIRGFLDRVKISALRIIIARRGSSNSAVHHLPSSSMISHHLPCLAYKLPHAEGETEPTAQRGKASLLSGSTGHKLNKRVSC